MTITEQDIHCATVALGRAEIFDDRMTSDKARIKAWAEAFAPFGFEVPTILDAVTAHYQTAGASTPKPGDIIALARKARGERAEREKGADLASLPAPAAPDPQLGGLPIANADGDPIWDAYEQHGAITITCPTCKSAPEHACLNLATNMIRKIPCVARLRDGRRAGVG
ncbi:hypothetical protein QSJ18_18300 [Gordonia sp. ABSL1-1]|uniref:hypothetical protein n=1 Tax=Gordonia sp. ABSL1-1 TaxID=3053923 RepID=UPI0025733878|nr:hypothetical protein [Gordonia sp. ABSL1-1]MDL9938702.1 hypothetical protein [Gordonia sp. ABSL1-1]